MIDSPLIIIGTFSCLLSLRLSCEGTCLVPSKDILDACNVGQLSVVAQNNMIVRNQALCNMELSPDVLGQRLNLKIENYYSFEFTKVISVITY